VQTVSVGESVPLFAEEAVEAFLIFDAVWDVKEAIAAI